LFNIIIAPPPISLRLVGHVSLSSCHVRIILRCKLSTL
jgi:hypothetical protein